MDNPRENYPDPEGPTKEPSPYNYKSLMCLPMENPDLKDSRNLFLACMLRIW